MINKDEKRSGTRKSFVFLTHAPGGTLGDPSAASKLIRSMKAKYGDSIDITMVLIVQDEYKDSACAIFKDLDIATLPVRRLDFQYEGSDTRGRKQNLDKIMRSSAGVIFFPTFHHFTEEAIKQVQKYNKPTFIVTEYDLHPSNKKVQLKKLGDFRSQCMQISSGLDKNTLGIFCTEEKNTSNNPLSLLQMSDPGDFAFRDLLLGHERAENYHRTHQLFFGYFSKFNSELGDHKANPQMFIESCLSMVSQDTKTVDFVLPLSLTNMNKAEDNKFKSIEELFHYFEQHPELTQGYRFEFWKKNAEGEMECLRTGGNGSRLIRFINAYPFTPSTMDKLLKASDEFVMITGDQSLSEAISHGKVFVYQTMWWKQELWNSLLSTVKECLTDDSRLYQYLQMQGIDSTTSTEEFKKFLCANKVALSEETEVLRQYILKNKNLYENLPTQLVSYILKPKTYLRGCLANSEQLSIKQVRTLVRAYPDEIDTIFNLIVEHNKFVSGKQKLLEFLSERPVSTAEFGFFQQYKEEIKKRVEDRPNDTQLSVLDTQNLKKLAYFLLSFHPITANEDAIYQKIYKELVKYCYPNTSSSAASDDLSASRNIRSP